MKLIRLSRRKNWEISSPLQMETTNRMQHLGRNITSDSFMERTVKTPKHKEKHEVMQPKEKNLKTRKHKTKQNNKQQIIIKTTSHKLQNLQFTLNLHFN